MVNALAEREVQGKKGAPSDKRPRKTKEGKCWKKGLIAGYQISRRSGGKEEKKGKSAGFLGKGEKQKKNLVGGGGGRGLSCPDQAPSALRGEGGGELKLLQLREKKQRKKEKKEELKLRFHYGRNRRFTGETNEVTAKRKRWVR